MRHDAPDAPKRITVLHGGALGDLILTLRLTSALKKRFPAAHLTLYARTDLSALGAGVGGVDTFRSGETSGLHELFQHDNTTAAPCAKNLSEADLILSCLGNTAAPFSERLRTITPGAVFAIDTAPRPGSREHITTQWLGALNATGLVLPDDTAPRIALAEDAVRASRTRLTAVTASGDRPIVLLHPGSGGIVKCWPQDHFEQLAARLRQRDARPCFLLGPVEMERDEAGLRDALSRHAPVLYDPSLTIAAGHVAAADVYVGNDAGMTHLAAAVGTSVVALFGPTDPAIWRPLGPRVQVLASTAAPDPSFDGVTVDAACRCVLRPDNGDGGAEARTKELRQCR